MKSISLKSHNSRDFERCIECTSTVICCVSIWRLSVCCQRASDPPGIPVAKALQVGEYSHSFTSPHKLAKATSCSSNLSKAPGEGGYFFLGAYMLMMRSALSFNKIQKPSASKDEKPLVAHVQFGVQPLSHPHHYVPLCSSPRRNLLSLLRNWASVRPQLLLLLLRVQMYFCIITQSYLFLPCLRSIYNNDPKFMCRNICILFKKRYKMREIVLEIQWNCKLSTTVILSLHLKQHLTWSRITIAFFLTVL